MGTSNSQASPDTTGWKAVSRCYENDKIPIERAAIEVWRAACGQDASFVDEVNSPVVTALYDASSRSMTKEEAFSQLSLVSTQKNNSLVGEFAKRAFLTATASGTQSEGFTTTFFRQLTDYLVSRDISGYVGPRYRCKSVHDVRTFKQKLNSEVSRKIGDLPVAAFTSWRSAASAILEALRTK